MPILLLMTVGVLAVSLSAPLVAYMTVPTLAIAFWRNGLSTAALAPVAISRRAEIRALGPRRLAAIGAAGVALAVHFATWVPSLRMTSVASATALVSLQLGWVVAWDLLRGRRYGGQALLGLAIAFTGTLVVTGVDVTVSRQALAGDVLALVGGVATAAYMVIGAGARASVSTSTYTFLCYGTCGLLLLGLCLATGQQLTGYPPAQWALLLLLTATAQLLGHSVFNHLLAVTTPMIVGLALLLEVPGASLLAALFLGQRPPPAALVGLVVVVSGMVLVIRGVGVRNPTAGELPMAAAGE